MSHWIHGDLNISPKVGMEYGNQYINIKTLNKTVFKDHLSLAVHFWFDHTKPVLGVSAVTDQQHESVSTSDLIDLVDMGCGTEVRHEVKETMTNIATKRDAFTTPKNDDLKYIEKLKIQVYIFSSRKCVYIYSFPYFHKRVSWWNFSDGRFHTYFFPV